LKKALLDNFKTLALAKSALTQSWRLVKGDKCFRARPLGYLNRPEDNLLSTVSFVDIEQDYGSAAGHELEQKFCAAYSSAALVANCFGPFRNDGLIPNIAGVNGLTSLRFEERLRHGLRSEPPNLDVVIRGPDVVVAVESKCTEYLGGKCGAFKPAYDPLAEKMEAGWNEVFKLIRSEPAHFCELDAAQLVKHYLGVRRSATERRKVLLYLFWEPLNAASFSVFADHRRQIAEFSKMVQGSEVEFQQQSYSELWRSWSSGASRALDEHLRQLGNRYLVELLV
jgi:hypothetical protein